MTTHYGLTPEQWAGKALAGYNYLAGIAALEKTASYPEFCHRVNVEPSDPALGGLLAEIARRSRAEKGVLLPALILAPDKGEPGEGFFAYASEIGMIPKRAKRDARFMFWAQHLKAVYAAFKT